MTIPYVGTFPTTQFVDFGFSNEAERITNNDNKTTKENSFKLLHREILINNKLINAIVEAQEENLEAYKLFSSNTNSLKYALSFLKNLPLDIPFPELYLDNDGDIAIEWDYAPRKIISIRIAKDGTLNFAWLVGTRKLHGIENYKDFIPETIFMGIQNVLDIRSR